MYGIVFRGFTVWCPSCHHETRPAKKPKEGIRKVLSGEPLSCRQCGAIFEKILIPSRPLVRRVEKELGFVSLMVKIVDSIPGTNAAKAVAVRV